MSRLLRTPRWIAELGSARLMLAALALLAAGTAATAVVVPADVAKSDAWSADSLVSQASYVQRDLVVAGRPGAGVATAYPKDAHDLGELAATNLAALPDALNRLVSETVITRQYTHPLPVVDPPAGLDAPAWLRVDWSPQLNAEVHYVAGEAPGVETGEITQKSPEGFTRAMSMTLPIAVSRATADRLGLSVGSTVRLDTAGGADAGGAGIGVALTLSAKVSGIYEPNAGVTSSDPVWHVADRPEPARVPVCVRESAQGCDATATVWQADVFVNRPEVVALITSLIRVGAYSTTYDYVVDPARLTPGALAGVGPALDQTTLGVVQFKGDVTLKTGLKDLAAKVRETQSDSHLLAAVVLGALSAGALSALFLMLRLVVLRRAREVALCEARGASPVRLALRIATQIAAVVAVSGLGGALLAVRTGHGTLHDPAAWSGVILVTLLAFGVVGWSVLRQGDRVVTARHEALGDTARIRRMVRDAGLLLAAGGALAIYRGQGSANPDGSIDWIAVAAPALLAFAAGIAAVRLVPALFGPAVRVLGRRRSVVGFVAAALSGRRVRVVAAPLAGLVVVVAAGMFAAGYDASVAQKVRDDTIRQVGAAARIDAEPDRSLSVADQTTKDPNAYQFADGFAAAAAKVPGVRSVLTGRVELGGIAQISASGTPEARPIAVITVDPEAFRRAAAEVLSGASARGPALPEGGWPTAPSADGTVSVLASPGLAGLFTGQVSISEPAGSFKAVFGAVADVPIADSVVDRGGTDYVVVAAGQVKGVDPGPANVAWFTGATGAMSEDALRALPGVTKSYRVTTLQQVRSAAYGEGRVSAARDVFHLVEALCVGYFALCLLQLLTATRTVSRDSALLLQVFGLRAGRSRLVAALVPLPIAVLAVAAGLGMGAGLSPMLGPLDRGAASGPGASVVATGSIGWGWTAPVAAVVLGLTVAGVLLDQALRRRAELSVRLRDAEFE
ncbi:hypothetical protein [Catenulispora subtropica]|uniref:ABC3 transporter permease protein domain-containing protein n=1 Tax=Catenulispora subtropica TaxID=450798 RepID=A0ABN2STG9_9ACTN